jgi:CRISPR-associated protein Csd2
LAVPWEPVCRPRIHWLPANSLDLLWLALTQMFDHERPASRDTMALQKLIVFKHDSTLGNAPAHKLFERVTVCRKASVEVARDFSNHDVNIARDGLPAGVEIIEKL